MLYRNKVIISDNYLVNNGQKNIEVSVSEAQAAHFGGTNWNTILTVKIIVDGETVYSKSTTAPVGSNSQSATVTK